MADAIICLAAGLAGLYLVYQWAVGSLDYETEEQEIVRQATTTSLVNSLQISGYGRAEAEYLAAVDRAILATFVQWPTDNNDEE